MNQYKPTSGEQLIEYYLKEANIKFEAQKEIHDLENDSKKYRVVDFYLPRLNVYVEYYGMYFSGDQYKKEYDIKSQVYIKNDLPTVVIYPNEVGVLDYTIYNKLKTVLKLEKFRKSKTLYRYLINRYITKGKGYTLFSALFWFYLTYVFMYYPHGLKESIGALFALISMLVLIYYIVQFLGNIIEHFYYQD